MTIEELVSTLHNLRSEVPTLYTLDNGEIQCNRDYTKEDYRCHKWKFGGYVMDADCWHVSMYRIGIDVWLINSSLGLLHVK